MVSRACATRPTVAPTQIFPKAETMTDQQPEGLTRLLSIQTVAKNLDVSIRTVRRWIDLDMIPVYRLGRTVRISADDVEAFIGRHRSKESNNVGHKYK